MSENDDFVPLTVQEFARQALETDLKRDPDSLNFALLGLFGEIGSLLSEVCPPSAPMEQFSMIA